MYLPYTAAQEDLRRQLREYFAGLMTPEVQDRLTSGDGEFGGGSLYKDLVARMGSDG
jgi:3-oxocholest-4-en-26-oyl-CoA dehydrogenase alpha subunit